MVFALRKGALGRRKVDLVYIGVDSLKECLTTVKQVFFSLLMEGSLVNIAPGQSYVRKVAHLTS